MAELGTVYVDIKGDWQNFEKNTKTGFAGVAKGAAAAFAGAFVVKEAFDFGAASVDAASSLGESVNAVQQSFDSLNAQKLLDLGGTAAETMGMSESAFNAFSVRVSGFANQIAGPGGDSAQIVEDLGGRIADFASVMNLDMEEATQVFTQSMAGEQEAAKRFGKDVSQAAVEAYALEEGLWDGQGAMDAQTLATARLGNLMDQTANVQDDFKNTSGGLANQQRIMAAEFENAKASLGASLLPALEEVIPILRDHLTPIISQLGPVFGLVGSAIAAIAPSVLGLVEVLMPLLVDILTPIIPVIQQVAEVFLALATPILELLAAALGPLLEILGEVAGALLDALSPALDAIRPLFDALLPIVELLFVLLEPFLPLIEMLAELVGAILGAALGLAAEALGVLFEILAPVIEAVADFAEELVSGLGEVLPSITEWFGKLPTLITDLVSGAAEWLYNTGKQVIDGLVQGIKDVANRVRNAIGDVIENISGAAKKLLGIGSPSKVMADIGRDTSLGLAQGITSGYGAVESAVRGLLPTVPALGLETYGGSTSVSGPLSMTFNAPVGGDMGLFADQVAAAQARQMRYVLG